MILRILPLALLLAPACRPDKADDTEATGDDSATTGDDGGGDDSDPGGDDGGDDTDSGDGGDGGDDTDSGDGGGGDDGGDDTGIDDFEPYTVGDWTAVSSNRKDFAAFGYELLEFNISETASEPYESLYEGKVPTFYVYKPLGTDKSDTVPLLVWLHGGTIGDDTAVELGKGAWPDACNPANVQTFVDKTFQAPSFIPAFVADRGWAMVIPRGDWCDVWSGLGPDDPVDPDRHFGYYHAKKAVDFVRAGNAGFLTSELYGWGTSAGAGAVFSFSYRYGGFSGVIFDSGLASTFNYEAETGDPSLQHIFGGEAYTESGEPNGDVYERYAITSAATLVEDYGYTVPTFVAWNTLDAQVPPQQPNLLIDAMDANYGAAVNHGSHDFDHLAPTGTYHVQSIYGLIPWGYFGYSFVDFLEGKDVIIVEAEDGCATEGVCTTGEVKSVAEDPSLTNYSKSTVIQVLPGSVGVAYSAPLPDGIQDGDTVTVAAVIKAAGHGGIKDTIPLYEMSYSEGGSPVSLAVPAGDMVPEKVDDELIWLNQYSSTRFSFTVTDASAGELSIRTTGAAVLYVDAVIYAVDP
jgi:hypothetical protein